MTMTQILESLGQQQPLRPTDTTEQNLSDLIGARLGGVQSAGSVPAANKPSKHMHGYLGDPSWADPRVSVRCDEAARPGYASCKAHEYLDSDAVLEAKVELLATLIQQSENCMAYTGAGISTASGIDDYATRAGEGSEIQKGREKIKTPWDAQPTLSHRALTALHREGHLKHWVQQNHDGLPQKAGYPQAALNEIHGAWFDPSNPVVRMDGSLRADLYSDMLEWEQRTDLCLTLGTSLAGMNADRVATTCARRAMRGEEGALGTVIVGLQRTVSDGLMALRIYARIDTLMELLAARMRLRLEAATPAALSEAERANRREVFSVPYDAQSGRRLPAADTTRTRLDLRRGSRVRVTAGPYEGALGEVVGRNHGGHYRLRCLVELRKGSAFKAPFELILGDWWPREAEAGALAGLPLVNTTELDGPGAQQPLEQQLAGTEATSMQEEVGRGGFTGAGTRHGCGCGGQATGEAGAAAGGAAAVAVGERYYISQRAATVTAVADVAVTFMYEPDAAFPAAEGEAQPQSPVVKGIKWFSKNATLAQ
jgi:NAD-dependent SIR2 family protein deacetylase